MTKRKYLSGKSIALLCGIALTGLVAYYGERNINSYRNVVEYLETERKNSSSGGLDGICYASECGLKRLSEKGTLKNMLSNNYGIQKAYEHYIKKHCKN